MESPASGIAESLGQVQPDPRAPRVDANTCSILYAGRQCRLGPGLLFRVAVHLLRRPGWYVVRQDLWAAVWGQDRIVTDEAIRQVVKRLRTELRAAGMPDLAGAIVGEQGCYRWDPIWRHTDVTEMSRSCTG